MREYRCRRCNRLLFRSPEQKGRVEIVCPDRRCRVMQTVFLAADREPVLTPFRKARTLSPETA